MVNRKRKIGLVAMSTLFITALSLAAIVPAVSGSNEENGSSMKKDQDGKVSEKEFMKHHQWMFEQNDVNQDGYLDVDEMRNLHKMVKKMHKRFDDQY